MKRIEDTKVFPFPLRTIQEVILNPEKYPLRDYKLVKRIDEKNWIEDYGDDYILRYSITQHDAQKIVLDNYQLASSSALRYTFSYTFTSAENNSWSVKAHQTIKKGDIFRRFNCFVDNHTKHSEYYVTILNQIYEYCEKITKEENGVE